jgi:hypothetical protein
VGVGLDRPPVPGPILLDRSGRVHESVMGPEGGRPGQPDPHRSAQKKGLRNA